MRDLHELDKYRLPNAVLISISFFGGDPKGNGVFRVRTFKSGRRFQVIATDGGGWDHVSVTPLDKPNKIATWDEMCEIKDMFFLPEEEAIEFHPKKSEYVNLAKNCLHLWRLNDGREWPDPYKEAEARKDEDQRKAKDRMEQVRELYPFWNSSRWKVEMKITEKVRATLMTSKNETPVWDDKEQAQAMADVLNHR